jgi:hypothetical protein
VRCVQAHDSRDERGERRRRGADPASGRLVGIWFVDPVSAVSRASPRRGARLGAAARRVAPIFANV